MVGCGGVVKYDLTISSTEGGSVTSPGEPGPYTYDEGEVVNLVAEAEEGYRFVNWTGDVDTIGDVNAASTAITMQHDCEITANFVAQYVLTIEGAEGGEVIMPGEGIFTYDAGTAVPIVAEAEEGYRFVNWIGDVDTVVYATSAFATITMHDHYAVTAQFEALDPSKLFTGGSGIEADPYRIVDWYQLSNVRYFLSAHYSLMNDLDFATTGYAEMASETANHGKGWQPIGTTFVDPIIFEIIAPVNPFAGSLDGQGHEIRDLLINRPNESLVGLYADIDEGGLIQDVWLVDPLVIGHDCVGGLAGVNYGTVDNSHSSGSVTGLERVGGVVGWNDGTVGDCQFDGSIVGEQDAGGLVGVNGDQGTVTNSYASGSVSGAGNVGGLVGRNWFGTMSNSYSKARVTGDDCVGGLVGLNGAGPVSNCHYNYDEVLINNRNVITIGALFAEDFEQWLANDKSLDVNERLSQEQGYYVIDDVSDFKQLLAFGQDDSLKFRLKNDLELETEANLYIPYLAGEFQGNSHKIMNLNFSFDFVMHVGLFGILSGGIINEVGVENVNIIGVGDVGGLVGLNQGTVGNSYAGGSVAGIGSVGGLVGSNHDTVRNSYSTGSVTGQGSVGGLVGWNGGIVDNSYYNYDEVLINGNNVITTGALFAEDFEQWLANDRFLDVNERLSQENGYYLINSVADLKELLAFGQNDSLRFRLKSDLDLENEADFYIPYLAGEFDGNGYKISDLSFRLDFVSPIGLFGYLRGKTVRVCVQNVNIIGGGFVGGLIGENSGGTVTDCYSTGSVTGGGRSGGLVGYNHDGAVTDSYSFVNVNGQSCIGGLVGDNTYGGIVSNSHFTGSVTGDSSVGGLVGRNAGIVNNSYSDGIVTAHELVGGLVGLNIGSVSNSYSTGSVTGDPYIGGLVGCSEGTVSNCFWDIETSGQASSDGGTGKTTAEMNSIATFSDAGWNIVAVADAGTPNLSYIWNIVDGGTYPFLSWEPVP